MTVWSSIPQPFLTTLQPYSAVLLSGSSSHSGAPPAVSLSLLMKGKRSTPPTTVNRLKFNSKPSPTPQDGQLQKRRRDWREKGRDAEEGGGVVCVSLSILMNFKHFISSSSSRSLATPQVIHQALRRWTGDFRAHFVLISRVLMRW